jgi:hypothetical protein
MPFVKGQSGNPAGRPVGSRNRFTREMDEALAAHGVALIEKVVTHAHAANPAAMRLCFDRLVPQGKNRPFSVELPPVETPHYMVAALSEVQRALGASEVTTEEASRLVDLVGRTARVLASKAAAEIELTERVARCEQALMLLLDAGRPAAQKPTPGEPAAAEDHPAPAAGAIVNNNAKTMAPPAAKAAQPAPAALAQRPASATKNEDPRVAAALDRAVAASLADVRPTRRESVKEQLMNSVSPSALLVGEITEKVLAGKTASVMPPLAAPARAA